MNENLVSIIMPAFNAEKFISDSIESVLAQTYTNFELIIVNDKSTDNTINIIKHFLDKDDRITAINNEINLGVAEARNVAVKVATGRFIAFLDSDDLWVNHKLEVQLAVMVRESAPFSFGGYEIIDVNSNKKNQVVMPPSKITYNDLLKGSQIGCLTVMFDRTNVEWTKMKSIGHEDYLAWLSILSQIDYGVGIQDTIGLYRVMDDSLSGNKFKAAKWQYSIYRNELKFGRLKSIAYFTLYVRNALLKIKNVESGKI